MSLDDADLDLESYQFLHNPHAAAAKEMDDVEAVQWLVLVLSDVTGVALQTRLREATNTYQLHCRGAEADGDTIDSTQESGE